MLGRGSPRLAMQLSKAAQKKPSPKATKKKKSPKAVSAVEEKTRANWDAMLKKTLVDILHEHKTPEYRGQNGWTPDAWNKMVKEFLERERHANFTRQQIIDKEKELKRDYMLLKEARKQSGVSWDEKRCMILAEPTIWKNIIESYPKASKFRTKSFPLFEALGELHDGQTAEGTYNFTSTQKDDPDHTQVGNSNKNGNIESRNQDVEDTLVDSLVIAVQDDGSDKVQENEEEAQSVERQDQRPQRRAAAVSRNGEEKEPKRQRKSANLEGLMERYIDMRTKQAEDEAAQLAREKEASQGNDFSIKKCVSVLSTMEVTKEEKVKAYKVFKDPSNRQIFLSACDDDLESALMWLKTEIA